VSKNAEETINLIIYAYWLIMLSIKYKEETIKEWVTHLVELEIKGVKELHF